MHKKPKDIKKPSGVLKENTISESNNIHMLAFENSAQPSIVCNTSNGKIEIANNAACKLLGYSLQELLTKTSSSIIDGNENNIQKDLVQKSIDGQVKGLTTAIIKSGKRIPCEITSVSFIENDIEKEIITLSDISEKILQQKNIDISKEKIVAEDILLAKTKQKKIDIINEKKVAQNIILAQERADVRLAENNEWIKYIAKTSYDVMWDWDIASGEIYVGDSIEEVFGYKVNNNRVHFIDFLKCLLPDEKASVNKNLLKILSSRSKSWDDSYMFKRHDGSVASATSRASIVRDEHGKAIRLIGAIQDVSRLQELENKLEEQAEQDEELEKLQLTSKFIYDVIWDWNILTNEVLIGEEFQKLFGYSVKNNIAVWNNYIHPDDKARVDKGIQAAIASLDVRWKDAYRFIRSDGSIAKVLERGSILRDKNGKAYRMIRVMQDISRKDKNTRSASETPENSKSILVEKVKNIIVELIRHSDERLQINFSEHLTKKLGYDYTYLSNLFSAEQNMSIQKFIITQKIERVKELIVAEELNLTQIAWKLHYSSVAHLSNQFKKFTGLTPTYFKQLNYNRDSTLMNV